MKKNLLVIGLGSMGKRRIRILKALYPACRIIGIDCNCTRAAEVCQDYKLEVYKDMDEIEIPIYAAFICTSPESHSDLINMCIKRNWHVFTEINLMDIDYEKNMNLAAENGVVLFLSSTLLYRDEIQYMLQKVKTDKDKKLYLYHVGQYLPDWHPWDNLNDFFASKKATNGCRELMAIKLPWIVAAFGKVASVKVTKCNVTRLNINFPDTYMIQLIHSDGTIGNITIDIVSRKAVRKLEIYNENIYLSWNGTPDSLIEKNIEDGTEFPIHFKESIHDKRYDAFINEAAYMKEVETFFEVVNGKKALYGFAEDQEIIHLINMIEEEI